MFVQIVGISTVSFVPSSKLDCSKLQETHKKIETLATVSVAGISDTERAINAQNEEIRAMIAAEQSVAAVGEEYIESEKDANGRLFQRNFERFCTYS